jgi:magnesium-transporting ATPase (P-type)
MTGETEPVHKNIIEKCVKKQEEIITNGEKNVSGKHDVPSPIIMSGTRMLTGEGRMVVLVVGEQSCLGKIQALLADTEAEPTPLQMKL